MMSCCKVSGILLRLLLVFACALPAAASAATVLVYGDSLSTGYGLPPGEGWVSLLARRLHAEKTNYKVANASISGETAHGGAKRIETTLKTHRPAIVIVELGGNDGLRGGSPEALRANLEAIIDACARAKARVLLVGMRLPPNYGMPYAEKFQEVFRDVAKRRKVPLVPFLLEGFAEQRELFQPDGIHPAAEAQAMMLDIVWKHLKPLLKK